MHEGLEAEVGDGRADAPDVVQRVLAGQHHAFDAEAPHHAGAALVVHRHLGGAVDLETGIHHLDEAHEADVLHDGGVDAPVDARTQVGQAIAEFGGLHQRIERHIDPHTAFVRDLAGGGEFIEGELGALVAGVEARRAEVDRIGPVGDGGPHGVEASGRGEEFGGAEHWR